MYVIKDLEDVEDLHKAFKQLINEDQERRRSPEQRTEHDKKLIKFAKENGLSAPPYPELEIKFHYH